MRITDRKKGKLRGAFENVLFLLLGSLLYAIGFRLFIEPNSLILGGATGLATVIERLCGLPVGLGILILNVPLLFWGIRLKGRSVLLRTLLGVLFSSVLVDVLAFLPSVAVEPFGAAVLGGAATGLGMALLLRRGYTSGGSDLAGSLLHTAFPFLSLGMWILLLDSFIVLFSSLWYRDLEMLVFSILLNVAFAIAFEFFTGGSRRGRLALIVTNRHAEIEKEIVIRLGRGVTELLGIGAYEGAARRVLLCAIGRGELYHLESIVKEKDPEAFLVITETCEVIGRGFASLDR